jgi:hypothetical protein
MKKLYAIFLSSIILMSLTSYAEVPNYINYQGRLNDSLGNPVAEGQYTVTFKIWTDSVGEISYPAWIGAPQTVDVVGGLFNCRVGPIPSAVFTSDAERYLGITVGSDDEIVPRTRLISAPYAFKAGHSDTADYAEHSAGPWYRSGSEVYLTTTSDSVIVGAALPDAKLHVQGDVFISEKLGIGTSSGSEPLVIGSDLGYYSGNMISIGNSNPTSTAGLIMGQNENNRAYIAWDNTDKYLYAGTRADGNFFGITFVLKDGNVGIGTADPQGKLHVVGTGNSSVQLPTGSVSSEEMLNEPGIAYVKLSSVADVEQYETTFLSLGIECPSSGYVMITANANVASYLQNDGYWVSTSFCISKSPGTCSGAEATWTQHQLENHHNEVTVSEIVTINEVFEIDSPGTESYYLVGKYWGTVGYIQLSEANMTAIFYPTWYGTGSFPKSNANK